MVNKYDFNGNQTEEMKWGWDPAIKNWIYDLITIYHWSALTTPVSNNMIEHHYIIYPNPTHCILTIETGITNQVSIEITSLNGHLLFQSKGEGSTHQIDLSSFENGLYFITVRPRDYVRTEKIIKHVAKNYEYRY